MQSLLKTIDFQSVIRNCRADAVLTESTGLDAQLAEQGKDGRMHASVALEFDNDKIVRTSRFARLMIDESDAKINGQSLRLRLVDKGNAVKGIFNRGDDVAKGVSCALREEFLAVTLVDDSLNGGHLNALLARSSVVVLLLDL